MSTTKPTTLPFEMALHERVADIPGDGVSPTGALPRALRLCFAAGSPERIADGVGRLCRAVETYLGAASAASRS